MSYFNADQRDHMRDMAALKPEEKCDCGWFRRGQCFQSCYGDASKGGFVPKEEKADVNHP